MKPLEKHIMHAIQLEASVDGCRLFRNNVGQAVTATGDTVRFGLGVGSSDLVGWDTKGRFLAVEVKRPGQRPTEAQALFISAVNAAGGVAGVCHSVEEFRKLVGA